MSRNVPTDRALSDEDRAYLESRGIYGSLIQRLDAEFGDGEPGGRETFGGTRQDASTPSSDPASTEPDAPTDNYDDMTKDELHEELTKRQLPKSGNKDEVIARLRADDASKS